MKMKLKFTARRVAKKKIFSLFIIATEEELIDMCQLTARCLKQMNLNINETKSASNIDSNQVFGNVVDDNIGYKYLGILEDSSSIAKIENKNIIRQRIYDRVRKLCQAKLNAKNMFAAVNEFAISTLNYFIGLIAFEPQEFQQIDLEIRKIMNEEGIVRNSANMDRLYLKREELGRGLCNIEEKAEQMLLNLYNHIYQRFEVKPIIENEKASGTFLGTIKEYLITKYEESGLDTLVLNQKKKRMEKIQSKAMHSVIFQNEDNVIDVKESSVWLKHGNITAKEEAMLTKLQDRNIFYDNKKCSHCNQARKTVDHLATQCGRKLDFDYKKRHNDIVRCIHFHYALKFGFSKTKKIKNYRVESVLINDQAKIKSDVPIRTELRLEHNKPDLFIHDLKNNKITLIEIGVTNKNILKQTEITKLRKYEVLANELKILHPNTEVEIIPIVITWDGLVTKFYKKYMDRIGIDKRTKAYVQSITIKRTCESVMIDRRVNHGEEVYFDEVIEAATTIEDHHQQINQ